MKKLPIALAIAAITAGSTHAADIIYSSEDFEGGTPNYTIGGDPIASTQLQDGGVNITANTALTGTDYGAGSPSRSGVFANGEPTDITPAGEPTGQHGFVSTSQNRSLILANSMPLVTDGVQSLNVSFKYMIYGLGDFDALGSAILIYSALGDFSDGVQIASFGVGQAGSWVETPDYAHPQDTWNSVSLSITPGTFGIVPGSTVPGPPVPAEIVFTDTAKFRLNRVPVSVTAPDNTTYHFVLFDDITITGIPGSAPAAPFMATITPAVEPDTGYDLQWPSQTGATYSVLTSTDLATPVDTWTVVEADLAASPPQNTYNVPADGVRRFYVIKETAP